jgi:hypothetical protein
MIRGKLKHMSNVLSLIFKLRGVIMNALVYSGKIVKSFFKRGIVGTGIYSYHVAIKKIMGLYIDIRYGNKLCVYKIDSKIPECHAVMHSDYYVLEAIFSREEITSKDVLVDVGCGQGRIINYWLSKGLTNNIMGLEINKEIAEDAIIRYKKYRNIQILQGDAIEKLPKIGTKFFLFNPFGVRKIAEMAVKLQNKPIEIIYYNYLFLEPFQNDNWNIEIRKSDKEPCKYRVAIITPRIIIDCKDTAN